MTTTVVSENLVAQVRATTGVEEPLATLGATLVVAIRTEALQHGNEVAARQLQSARSALSADGLFPNKEARKAFMQQLDKLSRS